jgi:DNA-binding LacI/PurR family transcriptional regulator
VEGRRVTSRDVAAAAGVSRATVSYVLNDRAGHRISAATRARVRAAADRLGYVPHAAATTLRGGRTSIVLLALPAWPLGPPMAEAVSALVGELDRLGYTPLVHFIGDDDGDALTRACGRVQPVGLIAPGHALPPERVAALRAHGTRAIVGLSRRPLGHVASFAFDQAAIGAVAIGHLADRGHRDVLALLPAEPAFAALAADRLAGAERAAAERGVTVVPLTAGLAELPARLAAAPPHTAVYAFNDEYALAAMAVPGGDAAVIGCDDSIAARYARPRLTTINIVAAASWRALAQRLHAGVEGEPIADLVAEPHLVRGQTT